MSILTPQELAQLQPAMRRADARRELAAHEAARRAGERPQVSLATWTHGRAAYDRGMATARDQLGIAFRTDVSREARAVAARAALLALPHELAQYAPRPQQVFRRKAGRSMRDVAEAVAAALASGQTGPRAARGSSDKYVQQSDLDDLVPDGWGRMFPLEVARLARRADLPPLAVPLLCMLTWVSQVKPSTEGRRCGAGFQVSLEWMARKLGCSETWVKHLFNRLDPFALHRRELGRVRWENARRARRGLPELPEPKPPTGTPYMHRFRRLVRYSDVPKRDGSTAACWVDKSGRVRHHVDVRGVCYVTDSGRALLVRRAHLALPRPGQPVPLRPNGALMDLSRRLLGMGWRLTARLTGDPPENVSKLLAAPAG